MSVKACNFDCCITRDQAGLATGQGLPANSPASWSSVLVSSVTAVTWW